MKIDETMFRLSMEDKIRLCSGADSWHTKAMEQHDIDAILPGEVIEWNVLSYIRDAAAFGENKVCFNIGHFSWEALGSRYAADWLGDITGHQVPVQYVPTGDIWNFQLP